MGSKIATVCLALAALGCENADRSGPSEPHSVIAQAVTVSAVRVTPAADTIVGQGSSVTLTVSVKDQAGKTIPPANVGVAWQSLHPARASVNSSGRVTSLATSGQALITATAGGKADTAAITLQGGAANPPSATASTITVNPSSIAQDSGVAIVTVIVRDAGGQPVVNAAVTVSATGTGNQITAPAPTDGSGITTARFSATVAGTRTLSVTANGVALSQTATVTVRNPAEAVSVVTNCPIPAVPAAGSVNLATDVTYTTTGGVPQKLDVAWPKTPGVHPVVILVHGGGWFKGDKSSLRNEILQLAAAGYTALSVNYRLVSGNTNRFPAAIQDLRCALRWIRSNASSYSLDPNRGAALGVSAGGHLAELMGLAANVTSLDGPCGTSGAMITIKAVVAYAGASDLRQTGNFPSASLPMVIDFLGGNPANVPSVAAKASPIQHTSAGDPLALLIHGTADPVVPPSHSSWLKSALNLAGVPATYLPLQGLDHSLQILGTTAQAMPGSCTTLAFLAQELQP